MKLVPTRRTDYAIRGLIYLANNNGSRSTAGDVAEAMIIPQGFLHQVFQALQRGGLVSSRPGRGGGYALTRDPTDVTILEIVEAVEGSLETGECALNDGPCRWDNVCALHWVWSAARTALVTELAAATLAQVARDDRELEAGTKEIPADTHRRPASDP